MSTSSSDQSFWSPVKCTQVGTCKYLTSQQPCFRVGFNTQYCMDTMEDTI